MVAGRKKDYCKRGHARTPDNLTSSSGCKICHNEACRRYHERTHIPKPPRTHCVNGHERLPENLDPSGRCRVCGRETQAKFVARRLANPPETCGRGHVLAYEGMTPTGRCKACNREDSARHDALIMRGAKAVREFCGKGHRMTPDNTSPRGRCLECQRLMREAVKNDPVRLTDRRERQRFNAEAARRKAGVPERNWHANSKRGQQVDGEQRTVDKQPFVDWLDRYLAANPSESLAMLCARAGVEDRMIGHIRKQAKVTWMTVVRFLDAVDAGVELHALYPIEGGADVPLADPVKPREKAVVCHFGGCDLGNGYGNFGHFCEGHAAQFERWRRELDSEIGSVRVFMEDDGVYV